MPLLGADEGVDGVDGVLGAFGALGALGVLGVDGVEGVDEGVAVSLAMIVLLFDVQSSVVECVGAFSASS